jgi:polyhydroxyalkanoate synthase
MLGTALEKIRAHSGSEDVSLMGWCMGGLLCLLHQGQVQDPAIRNIITIASPIDLESGRGVIAGVAGAGQGLNVAAQLVSNYTNLRMKALDPARLALPPWATTLVFKMTDPVGSVTTYWDLVTRLSDREFVKSHSTTADYLNHMLLYPGGVIRDMAVKVVGEGQLATGRMDVGDQVAELDKIRSNLLAFAGATDILVPAEIARKIVDIVASKDKDFRIAPGGHMGVIIGSKAQDAVWAQSVEWLAHRSAATPPRARRRAAGPAKSSPRSKRAGKKVARRRVA